MDDWKVGDAVRLDKRIDMDIAGREGYAHAMQCATRLGYCHASTKENLTGKQLAALFLRNWRHGDATAMRRAYSYGKWRGEVDERVALGKVG